MTETLKLIKTGHVLRRDLRNQLGVKSSNLSQILLRLEKMNFVEREGDVVRILPKGLFLLEICEVSSRFERVFDRLGDLVNELDIGDIPEWLISRLYELDPVEVVDVGHDFLEPHREFLSTLANARRIKGYTPVFFREHVNFFLDLAEKDNELEIIVSEDVFKKILTDFSTEFQRGLSLDNVRFYVSEKKFRFAFAVAENILSISFYLRTGVFDYKRDFLCRGSDAVRWGNDLFEFVRKNSQLVDKQKLRELLQNQ